MDISWLIAPVQEDAFVKEHWGRAPLRIARGNSAYYSQLLSEADIEFILYVAVGSGAVELLIEDHNAQKCSHHEQAIAAFRNGMSLRISGINRFSAPMTMFSRNLELAISSQININMYLTPGSGKKALDRHYDTHDVFVLQIHGNKIWRLYGPHFPSPLERLPLLPNESNRDMHKFRLCDDFSGKDKCTLFEEFTLSAGDLLYLPRGFWHEAESEPGKVSCHLTVGIQPTTYLDLMTAALSRAASTNSLLRESLPCGFAINKSAADVVASQVARIAEILPDQLNPVVALDDLVSTFVRRHKNHFENNLLRPTESESTDQLDGNSQIHLKKGTVCSISSTGSSVELAFGSKAFSITGQYEDACRFIAKTNSFTIDQLPGKLLLAEKLALVKQLISEGMLTQSIPSAYSFEMASQSPDWVPIKLDVTTNTVQWMNMGRRPLNEPFLHQTVKRHKEQYPAAQIKNTSLDALTEIKKQLRPSGFIFHISRCGSTLLSNGLKWLEGAVVVSESQPMNAALGLLSRSSSQDTMKSPSNDDPAALLEGLVRAYGQKRLGTETNLIFKLSSWNILHMQAIRQIWPLVPCIIVVRDPLEVAVSCIEAPPGWMSWKSRPADLVRSNVSWALPTDGSMSDATFCARMIGKFLECAEQGAETGCKIIDYSDLIPSCIEDVARFFNIDVTAEESQLIKNNFLFYSKDPDQKITYYPDGELKRGKASDDLRAEVDKWAYAKYEALIRNLGA